MLKDEIAKELNLQMQREFQASYQYLAMSAYCESRELSGFANWLRVQAAEEHAHAMKFYDYLNDHGQTVVFEKMDKPNQNFASLEDLFTVILKQEEDITEHINKLANLASAKGDQVTLTFLGWFLTEQVEEMALSSSILEKVKMIGDNKAALYLLNQELGDRKD